jgi:hypothetical protein
LSAIKDALTDRKKRSAKREELLENLDSTSELLNQRTDESGFSKSSQIFVNAQKRIC